MRSIPSINVDGVHFRLERKQGEAVLAGIVTVVPVVLIFSSRPTGTASYFIPFTGCTVRRRVILPLSSVPGTLHAYARGDTVTFTIDHGGNIMHGVTEPPQNWLCAMLGRDTVALLLWVHLPERSASVYVPGTENRWAQA